LGDATQRPEAVEHLQQAFNDCMGRNGNNTSSAEVKGLLDTIVEPLEKTYVGGNVDDRTRVDLIKLLADTRDARATPAFAKALRDYEPGRTDDDARFACSAIDYLAKQGVKLEQPVVDELWNVFSKFHPSKAKSERLYHAIHDAILSVHDPSYGDKAADKLAAKVEDSVDSKMDQLQWWQLTSIQVLSALRYAKAAKPLVLVLLTPSKQDLNATTRTCLLKIGPAAEIELIKALEGQDPDYALAGAGYKDKGSLAIVADALALLSRPAGRDAILAALPRASTDSAVTGLAQALVQFPEVPAIEPAFQAAYRRLKWTASVDLLGPLNPKGALAQASANFFDPSLTDWLAREVGAAPEDSKILPLEAAIKVMPAEKRAIVGAALKKAWDATGDEVYIAYKQIFDLASDVATKCKKDVGCYLLELDVPIPSKPGGDWKAIKAAWMAVAYTPGATQAATRGELLARVDKVKDAGARLALVEAIDELAPKGDTATADALDQIIAADMKAGDRNLLMADDAVAKVALRLRARAAP
jgi:hypothetical protein